MSDELNRSMRYRNYSEELRVIANEATHVTRDALLKAADEYAHLANSLEAIHRSKVGSGRRVEPSGRFN